MILAGPRLWRRNSRPLAACTESGFEPYLFGPALPRRQPIPTNPQIESAKPASARTQCSLVPAAPANMHLSPAGPALPARHRTPAATMRFLPRSCSRSVWKAMPHSSHGMKTIVSMRMKSGAARSAAVSRMTPTSNPALQKMRSERQFLARLMRPLAPNRNSNSSSIAFQHASAPTKPVHLHVS